LATKVSKKAAVKKAATAPKKTATKKAAVKKPASRKPASKKAVVKTKKKTPIAKTDVALEKLHEIIIDAMQDRKALNIVSLDLRTIEDAVADYFIICTGEASTQIKAIADNVEIEVRKKLKEKPWHTEGMQNLEWVIADYVNIVIHVFNKDAREFYKLEDLWSDADKKTYS
jgi:ribosome-associated protein